MTRKSPDPVTPGRHPTDRLWRRICREPLDYEHWLRRGAFLLGKFPDHARREIPPLLGAELREHILQFGPGQKNGVYRHLLEVGCACIDWTRLGWYLYYDTQRYLRELNDHD